MTMMLIPLVLAAAMPAVPAAEPQCAATPAAPPSELAAWSAPRALVAATSVAGGGKALLQPGGAAELALAPTPQVAYAVRPERPGGSVSHGGLLTIRVARAGTYRIAIDSAAWLDVVAGGKLVDSVNHGRGPACTGIRKMVDFRLEAGDALLQIAGNGKSSIRVIVAAVPAS